ncbi:50S ribosomal protein L11 methyltransferase [Sinimarinibacterium sp. CAU 1509]|nr:50S ribosomal protein L11 methyltransferase [Sinimarinibacterium sp. CAU 1509]TJY65232.1 50S ribosomal protein L11 methyltransferase [Sinimarinibacterium sp. CAU 1509]
MAWLQLRVQTAHPEFADELLLAHGAQAVSFIDAEDNPVLEPAPGETRLWSRTVTIGLFTDDTDLNPVITGLRELLPDGADAAFADELIEDQDWIRIWLKDCPPLKFGERLWVVPHEKASEVTQSDAVLLRLDPGLAFGTGTHPTTALCLEWLATQDLSGKTVLDYGCGSGVLAIAALLLGAERAVCVDIDPQALTATRSNAADNGVADRVTTLLPADFVPFPADIVVANILAGPLLQLAPLLASSITPGGRLALAGLLDRHAQEIRDAYDAWFDCDDDVSREGWTRISAQCRMPALIALHRYGPLLASAGQPQPLHFPVLAQAGYTAVINLAMPTSPNYLDDEAQLCANAGLSYHAIPVPFDAPTPQHAQQFLDLMKTLSGQKVLVHCALNLRASAFVFLHRVLNLGDSVEAARQELHTIWQPAPAWSKLIETMLATDAN